MRKNNRLNSLPREFAMNLKLFFFQSIMTVSALTQTIGVFGSPILRSGAFGFNQTGHLLTDSGISSNTYDSLWLSKTNSLECVFANFFEVRNAKK